MKSRSLLYSKREVDELVRWSTDLMENSERRSRAGWLGRELAEEVAGLIHRLL